MIVVKEQQTKDKRFKLSVNSECTVGRSILKYMKELCVTLRIFTVTAYTKKYHNICCSCGIKFKKHESQPVCLKTTYHVLRV